nr:MAG TPA: hypothetical protein [Caudoviricetes sp.]
MEELVGVKVRCIELSSCLVETVENHQEVDIKDNASNLSKFSLFSSSEWGVICNKTLVFCLGHEGSQTLFLDIVKLEGVNCNVIFAVLCLRKLECMCQGTNLKNSRCMVGHDNMLVLNWGRRRNACDISRRIHSCHISRSLFDCNQCIVCACLVKSWETYLNSSLIIKICTSKHPLSQNELVEISRVLKTTDDTSDQVGNTIYRCKCLRNLVLVQGNAIQGLTINWVEHEAHIWFIGLKDITRRCNVSCIALRLYKVDIDVLNRLADLKHALVELTKDVVVRTDGDILCCILTKKARKLVLPLARAKNGSTESTDVRCGFNHWYCVTECR